MSVTLGGAQPLLAEVGRWQGEKAGLVACLLASAAGSWVLAQLITKECIHKFCDPSRQPCRDLLSMSMISKLVSTLGK